MDQEVQKQFNLFSQRLLHEKPDNLAYFLGIPSHTGHRKLNMEADDDDDGTNIDLHLSQKNDDKN